ncbi:methionyl-tRNA formyltransferase [Paenibacillus oryzisoli]|uniref:Formyl transferase n=1 Tax=Paenibacillus oryzisoli TaxID=1850517 RepID=A0A198A0H0_9BACL|nr:formyltransferase family protein [Paenibacillus oryzisoli]OAS14516.1 formyl transferase [Paenibacillus oryzisoli]
MRIIFIGCVAFSYKALQCILRDTEAEVVGVVTKKQSPFNADFQSLEPLCSEYQIPVLLYEKNNLQLKDWIKEFNPDVIYCLGWSHLLDQDVLDIPEKGIIGFHPAALPQNRGRHPIIWALALGLRKTASTYFLMTNEADTGDIISQEEIEISDHDDAGTLYRKIEEKALLQIPSFTEQLIQNTYKKVPQKHDQSNSWRKRNKQDGQIDWRMSAKSIYNLIRALTKPYVGAHFVYQEKEVKVWKSRVVNPDDTSENIEPGKILKVTNNTVYIKCGEGIISLLEHDLDELPTEGGYL